MSRYSAAGTVWGHTESAREKKHLAAGILAMAGYKGDRPVVDPMCGSGTFLIEAALIALKIYPGNFCAKVLRFRSSRVFSAMLGKRKSMTLSRVSSMNCRFKMYGYDPR